VRLHIRGTFNANLTSAGSSNPISPQFSYSEFIFLKDLAYVVDLPKFKPKAHTQAMMGHEAISSVIVHAPIKIDHSKIHFIKLTLCSLVSPKPSAEECSSQCCKKSLVELHPQSPVCVQRLLKVSQRGSRHPGKGLRSLGISSFDTQTQDLFRTNKIFAYIAPFSPQYLDL
jgi:hypothetical protein